MKDQMLSIEYVALSSLKLNPENPRVHTNKQIGQIAKSIQTFGFNVPILIDFGLAGNRRARSSSRLQATGIEGRSCRSSGSSQ
jgi:ParB-like chromosome segregation protein Spo0J